jgi:hypothetical protein
MNNNKNNNYNNNNNSLFTYLHAELNSKWPISQHKYKQQQKKTQDKTNKY